METSAILAADILDIIFDGKNKSYGAYELRRSYSRRLFKALVAMMLLVLLLIVGFLIAANRKGSTDKFVIGDTHLVVLPPQPDEPIVKPPPIKPPEQPKVQMKKYMTFLVMDDK